MTYYADGQVTLLLGDAVEVLTGMPDASVDCVVTSPPYWGLRDYHADGQYGLEESPAAYADTMRRVFAEVRRVLADDGTLFLNLGDSYNSTSRRSGIGRSGATASVGATKADRQGQVYTDTLPTKSMLMIPARIAMALQDDGWILRSDIIWHKPNAMPESVTDRPAGRHEHLFLLAKSQRYRYEAEGRPGDVWTLPTRPHPQAHFAAFPIDLPLRAIKAGCKPGGTVLDPFSGSGTTGEAARRLGRRYVGIDLSAEYHDLAIKRYAQGVLPLGDAEEMAP